MKVRGESEDMEDREWSTLDLKRLWLCFGKTPMFEPVPQISSKKNAFLEHPPYQYVRNKSD